MELGSWPWTYSHVTQFFGSVAVDAFSINIKRLKKKKTQKYYILLSHPRQERTLGPLVPTPDETYNSKTILQKEYKQGESGIAWYQIIREEKQWNKLKICKSIWLHLKIDYLFGTKLSK